MQQSGTMQQANSIFQREETDNAKVLGQEQIWCVQERNGTVCVEFSERKRGWRIEKSGGQKSHSIGQWLSPTATYQRRRCSAARASASVSLGRGVHV